MQWFKDMFTMIEDLRAEAPGIGRWGFALNMPMWVGGVLFIQRPEVRSLVLFWSGQDRAFECAGATAARG